MARVEHYHSENPPAANSLVPAASAVVADERGRILMQRRVDNGYWALPGGTMELGESIVQTAVREVFEETGYRTKVTGLVGVYTDPTHLIEYSDGEIRQQFNICFTARLLDGALRGSAESSAVAWIEPSEINNFALHESQRLRLHHYLAGSPQPYLG